MPNLHSDKRYLSLSSLLLLFVHNVNPIHSKQIQAGKSHHDSLNPQGILGNPALPKSDLVTGIHGIQVDICARTVQWMGGQCTVLPWLSKGQNGWVENVLFRNANHVKDPATIPKAYPKSMLIEFLDRNLSCQELFKRTHEALTLNKTVVVRGYAKTYSFDSTVEDLESTFQLVLWCQWKCMVSFFFASLPLCSPLIKYGQMDSRLLSSPCQHKCERVHVRHQQHRDYKGLPWIFLATFHCSRTVWVSHAFKSLYA